MGVLRPGLIVVLASITVCGAASAQPSEVATPAITPGGYVEVYDAYNFGRPSNGITNFRAFDDRHATFTLENAVISIDARGRGFFARVALQSGSTGETYYASEPARPGADGAAAGGPAVFKHVQEAYAGFRAAESVDVTAGLYLSPIGPEAMAIKDTWLWSRSNLFYGLPFYHTGARVTFEPTSTTTLHVGVLNGWNSVIDNNDTPSISAKATIALRDDLTLDAHYLGGIERDRGAPEGPAWRSLFDTYVTWKATSRLELVVNGDLGVEPNRLGFAGWAAGALFARYAIVPHLFIAARSDLVEEKRARRDGVASAPILFPSRWLTSHAVALDLRPVSQASVRLEYRHDASADAIFFHGEVTGAGSATDPWVPNARSQDTLALGLTAWF